MRAPIPSLLPAARKTVFTMTSAFAKKVPNLPPEPMPLERHAAP